MPQRTSTEYVSVTIGGDLTGLTQSAIEIQVTGTNDPTSGTWHVCDLWTSPVAKLLVGTTGTAAWPTGQWAYVYVRVTLNPEKPVLYAGRLVVEG